MLRGRNARIILIYALSCLQGFYFFSSFIVLRVLYCKVPIILLGPL